MPTVISERTIDSLFAFEALAAAPDALIHSPANNAGPMTPDHVLGQAGRCFVFELKTISRISNNQPNWYIDVPMSQLRTYVTTGDPVIYLLPSEPHNQTRPWIRTCQDDPDSRGRCLSCADPVSASGVMHDRRWAGQSPWVQSADHHYRLQPWFNHWAWCVKAVDLLAYLTGGGPDVGAFTNSWRVSAADSVLDGIPRSLRFCHLLDAISNDPVQGRGASTRVDLDAPGVEDRPLEEQGVLEPFAASPTSQITPTEESQLTIMAYGAAN